MRTKHVYLNLFNMDFPITAITSILHRITGVLLFLSLPIILYIFKLSLASNSSFIVAKSLMTQMHIKFFVFVMLSSFIYHMIFGIKHIIIDMGFFDTKRASGIMSVLCLLTVIFFVILSVFI